MESKNSFEISWNTLWKILIFGTIGYIFYSARSALAVLLVSFIISLGLDPIISLLERKKISRLLGTLIVFLAALLTLFTIFYFIVPLVVFETRDFLKDFDKSITTVFGLSFPEWLLEELDITLQQTLQFLSSAHISITGAISSVLRKVVYLLATLIISFYLTVQKGGPERFLKVLAPDIYEKPILVVFNRFTKKIRRWFVAQLGLSVVVGTVVSLGLWLLGVKYSLVLGLLAAILELVPVVGPIVAGAVAVLVALSGTFMLSLYVLIFFIIVQQLENNILIPVILGKTMKIHPVVVIISLLSGSQIAGFVGIILAVPIAVMSQEIYNYLAEKKVARNGLGL